MKKLSILCLLLSAPVLAQQPGMSIIELLECPHCANPHHYRTVDWIRITSTNNMPPAAGNVTNTVSSSFAPEEQPENRDASHTNPVQPLPEELRFRPAPHLSLPASTLGSTNRVGLLGGGSKLTNNMVRLAPVNQTNTVREIMRQQK